MTTQAQAPTIGGTLASDPARWGEPLLGHSYGSVVAARTAAEREIASTASAVLGNHARIVLHHNVGGTWAVDIERAQGTKVYHVHWSSLTVSASHGGMSAIMRGEALTTLLHELFHVLFTGWVERPDWCERAHWQDFFGILNMTEDVRIEDAGEQEVPVFAALRSIENERLLMGNVHQYDQMDALRHVGLALYSTRCIPSRANEFVSRLSGLERAAFNDALPHFLAACDTPSTQALLDALEPVYVAMQPLFPPVGGGGGGGGEPDDDERKEDGDEQEGGEQEGGEQEGGEQGGNGGEQEQDDDGDEQAGVGGDEQEGNDDEESDGEDGEEQQEEGDSEQEGGNGGDDGGGGEGGGDSTESGTSHGGVEGGDGVLDDDDDEPMRPDRPRGEWDKERKDTERAPRDTHDAFMDGSFIGHDGQSYDISGRENAVVTTSRVVRSQLNRVLQHNADGSYAGRRRRGSFDVKSSSRLALGDTRVFRTKQGPRGARDFSLVLLLDASSSVRGACGNAIANAGLAIKRASDGMHGLDVAVAAYGGHGPIAAIPFDATARQHGSFHRLLDHVSMGSGGGTDETSGIIWARNASLNRGAEQPLIVVLTDGHPNNRHTVAEEIDLARKNGIITGGIGISRKVGLQPVVPDYHEFYSTARDLAAIPRVLGDLIRSMMRAH